MARPIAWLRRLDAIRSTIANAPQTSYERVDLEKIFKISSRAANNLLASLPNTAVGKSLVVGRQELSDYLEYIAAAENQTAAVLHHRTNPPREKAGAQKTRKLRRLISPEKACLDDIPENVTLGPGLVTLRFKQVEELIEAFKWFGLFLSDNLNLWSFINQFEPPVAPIVTEQTEEMLAERRDAENLRF